MTDEQKPLESTVSESADDVEDLIDEWGEDSFPASDPPGSLPPSLDRQKPSEHLAEPEFDPHDPDRSSLP